MSNEASDPTLPQRAAKAAGDLYTSICEAIGDSHGVHLETAVAAASYLAGTSILKNCGVNISSLKPGSPVFVEKVNEIGPMVVDTLMGTLAKGGLDPKAPMVESVPPANHPRRSYEELLQVLWPRFRGILMAQAIPPEMAAFVAARAAGQIILDGRQHLNPAITRTIAVEALVRASKTVPPVV